MVSLANAGVGQWRPAPAAESTGARAAGKAWPCVREDIGESSRREPPSMIESETPIEHAGTTVLTLRQLDRLNGVPKGTSFRAFKRALPALTEGRDFFVLDPARDAERIAGLKAAGQAYPGSVQVVLVTRAAYARMRGEPAD